MWSKQIYIIRTKGKEMRAKSIRELKLTLADKPCLYRNIFILYQEPPVWLYYISHMIALDLQPPQFGEKRKPCSQGSLLLWENPGKEVGKSANKASRAGVWGTESPLLARFALRFFCCFTPFLPHYGAWSQANLELFFPALYFLNKAELSVANDW